MQFKLSALVAATLATAVLATGPSSQCNTGPVQCCNSLEKADGATASQLLGLLGVVVQDVNVLVGITCSPISVIGVGGNSCTAQTVCCENNNFNGIIALGCNNINI